MRVLLIALLAAISYAQTVDVQYLYMGKGSCSNQKWTNMGTAKTLEEAKIMMLSHELCSSNGSVLFYSRFSFSNDWGVKCMTSREMQHCTTNNPKDDIWERYILIKTVTIPETSGLSSEIMNSGKKMNLENEEGILSVVIILLLAVVVILLAFVCARSCQLYYKTRFINKEILLDLHLLQSDQLSDLNDPEVQRAEIFADDNIYEEASDFSDVEGEHHITSSIHS